MLRLIYTLKILMLAFALTMHFTCQALGYETHWGESGTGNGQFNMISGLAVDGSGNIYVVDRGNNRIQKFSNTGTFITKWGSLGSGDGQFKSPEGIAIDASGNVYIADNQNHRIQKFNSTGTFLAKWGTQGTGNGQLDSPSGVAVDPATGYVCVSETGNSRIHVFTNTGGYITKWGFSGFGDGQFSFPTSIAIDASSNLYITDKGNHRIQKLDILGNFIAKWGHGGATLKYDGYFQYPHGIAVSSGGEVYVTDQDNHRVQKFSNTGTFYYLWSNTGTTPSTIQYPQGITIDGSGYVYVADYLANRIIKYNSTSLPDARVTTNGNTTMSDGTFTFNTTAILSSSSPVQFSILNTSIGSTLELTGSPKKIELSGAHASDFIIDESSITSTSITGGTSVNFTVVFSPSASGLREADLTIASSDMDENPYVIHLQGEGESTGPNGLFASQDKDVDILTFPNPCEGKFRIDTEANDVEVALINPYGVKELHYGKEITTELKGLITIEIKSYDGTSYSKIFIR